MVAIEPKSSSKDPLCSGRCSTKKRTPHRRANTRRCNVYEYDKRVRLADRGQGSFRCILSDLFRQFPESDRSHIDVMIDTTSPCGSVLEKGDPERSLFSLLTPKVFKNYPSSRLYGWLMQEYKRNPCALQRDLPHRQETDWTALQKRIGWITFEDFQEALPSSCPWSTGSPTAPKSISFWNGATIPVQ